MQLVYLHWIWGLEAYAGAHIDLALSYNNFGIFAGSGTILKINLDTFEVNAKNYFNVENSIEVGFIYSSHVYFAKQVKGQSPALYKHDLGTLQQLDQITLPYGPKYYIYSGAVSSNFAYLGVGNGTTFSVVKYNLNTNSITSTLSLSSGEVPIHPFVYDHYLTYLFDNNIVGRIDLNTFTVTSTLDISVRFYIHGSTQKGQYGYFGSSEGDFVKIDIDSLTVVQNKTFTGFEINQIILGSDYGYLIPDSSGTILRIDLNTLAVLGNFSVANYGYGYAVGMVHNNNLILGSDSYYSTIIQIDLTTYNVVDSIALLYNSSNPLSSNIVGKYGYFVSSKNIPSTIVTADLDAWKVVDKVTITGNFNLNVGIYYNNALYYATQNVYALALQTTQIIKVSTEPLAKLDSLQLPTKDSITSAVVVRNVGYFSTTSNIYIINLDSFKLENTVAIGGYVQLVSPFVSGYNIYYGSGNGHSVYKFDTTVNATTATIDINDNFITTGFISGNYLYYTSQRSELWKIDLTTFNVTGYINMTSKIMEFYSGAAVGDYGYIGIKTYPRQIVKIDLKKFAVMSSIMLDSAASVLFDYKGVIIVGGDTMTGKLYYNATDPKAASSPGGSKSGLSTGAIIGIVIGAAVAILIAILIVWLLIKKKLK